MARNWFRLVVALSGAAAALVYEVTWTRLLALQLGHGVAAASTVLAAFMGGMAVGALAEMKPGGAEAPPRPSSSAGDPSGVAVEMLNP